MASKNSESKRKNKKNTEVRVRKWTEYELKQFAYVLADDIDDFAYKLESLALKKSANEHIFQRIKEEFDARLSRNSDESQREDKVNNNPIDTSIPKLRNKYKYLKDQWRKITDRAKTGSGKKAKDDPEWYKILDPVFNETHTKLKLASQADDIVSSNSSDEESGECDSSTEKTETCGKKRSLSPSASGEETEKSELVNKSDQTYTISEDSDSTEKMSKVKSNLSLVAPRKRKKVTTQAQALSQLSTSLESLGESQKERMEMWLMAEQKREEAYLRYQERQSELNRQHELRMVQLIAGLQNKGNPQPPIPAMHTHLRTGLQPQHSATIAQHPNTQHNAWSMVNSAIPYHPSNINNSNEEPIYTNLDAIDYNK